MPPRLTYAQDERRPLAPAPMTAYDPAVELWVAIPETHGRWAISDRGRLKVLIKQGSGNRLDVGTIRLGDLTLKGYRRFRTGGAGRLFRRAVHILVLETFVGPCPPGHEAAHLNGDRQDNCLGNLAWVTPVENASHKRLHGTDTSGERNSTAKLSAADVAAIRDSGHPTAHLAARFGVSRSQVNRIRAGLQWSLGGRGASVEDCKAQIAEIEEDRGMPLTVEAA